MMGETWDSLERITYITLVVCVCYLAIAIFAWLLGSAIHDLRVARRLRRLRGGKK